MIQDLRVWWPKLREGGLFSGDDYMDYRDTPFLPRGKAYSHYGKDVQRSNRWGVIRAVTQFAKEVGASVHITWFPGKSIEVNPDSLRKKDEAGQLHCYFYPAWYMIKPPAGVASSLSNDTMPIDDEASAASPPEPPPLPISSPPPTVARKGRGR